MIHYHVWFNLRPTVTERVGLRIVHEYLRGLCRDLEAARFSLLFNKGSAPRSKLPKYHALVEFVDSQQLATAMKNQAARGIHVGPHGEVIEAVSDFHVEIFEDLDLPVSPLEHYACEI